MTEKTDAAPPAAPGPTWATEAFAALNAPDVTEQVNRPPAMTARDLNTVIPLGDLAESPLNPRQTFGGMVALADSIRRVGLVQPLVVRPTPGPNPPAYEIVCGHRRFRAAREAGLAEVPCKVVALDDVQALEAMLTENGQRDDLTHLEQAETMAALRVRGWTVEQIATRLSMPVGTVYHRLKLLDLCPEARQALADGVLPSSVAVPLARLPTHALQAKALDVLRERFIVGAEPMAARDAVEWLQREFTRPLKLAPFSLTNPTLLEGVPACSECPKNSRAATPGLFDDMPDKRAAVCTDSSCFVDKAKASLKIKSEAKAKKGFLVLSPADGARLFASDGTLPLGSAYVDAATVNHADPKRRTWAELAEKVDFEAVEGAEPMRVYAPDKSLTGRDLFDRARLVRALADTGLAWAKTEADRTKKAGKAPPEKSKAEVQAETEAHERRVTLIDLVLSAVGAHVAKAGVTAADWRALALTLAQRFVSPDVLDLFGLDSQKVLLDKIGGGDPTWAIRFLFVSILRDSDLADGDGEPVPSTLATFAKSHGVSVADVAKALDNATAKGKADALFKGRK